MQRIASRLMVFALALLLMVGIAPAQQGRKLTFFAHPVMVGVLGNGKLLEEFTKKTGITVELITNADINTKAAVDLAGGSTTDLYAVNDAYWTTTLSNFFEPLESYLKGSPLPGGLEDFSKGMVRQFRVPQTDSGTAFALPFRMNADILFYRKDLFQKYGLSIPRTLDEYYKTARALKAALAKDGITDMFPAVFQASQTQFGVLDWYDWASPLGVDLLVAPDWKQVAFNTPASVKALQIRRNFIAEGLASQGVLSFSFDDAINAMAQEKAAMTIMTMAYWARLENPQNSKVAGKLGYAPAPRNAGIEDPYFVRGWGIAINKASRNKADAWEFIKWFTSPENQMAMALNGNPASRLSVMRSEAYKSKIPTAAAEEASLSRAKIQPNHPRLAQVNDILAKYLNAALSGKMGVGDALSQAEREANALLK